MTTRAPVVLKILRDSFPIVIVIAIVTCVKEDEARYDQSRGETIAPPLENPSWQGSKHRHLVPVGFPDLRPRSRDCNPILVRFHNWQEWRFQANGLRNLVIRFGPQTLSFLNHTIAFDHRIYISFLKYFFETGTIWCRCPSTAPTKQSTSTVGNTGDKVDFTPRASQV